MKKTIALQLDRQYTDEAELLRDTLKWLAPQERSGIKVLRICDRYTKGYSDLFLCVNGWFVVAELKDDTGDASPQQLEFIDKMQKCGAIGGVCRTIQEVANLIDEAQKRVPHGYQ